MNPESVAVPFFRPFVLFLHFIGIIIFIIIIVIMVHCTICQMFKLNLAFFPPASLSQGSETDVDV